MTCHSSFGIEVTRHDVPSRVHSVGLLAQFCQGEFTSDVAFKLREIARRRLKAVQAEARDRLHHCATALVFIAVHRFSM